MTESPPPQSPPRESWTAGTLALLILLAALGVFLVQHSWTPKDIYLADLPYEVLESGEMEPVNNQTPDGETLQIFTTYYPVGIVTQANTRIELRGIPANQRYFVAEIGLDARNVVPGSPGGVVFTVMADGTVLYESPVMTREMPPRLVHVPIQGRNTLTLQTRSPDEDTRDDFGIWAMARFSSK